MTPCPDSHGEEKSHEEAVGQREPVHALLAVPLQVDVPPAAIFHRALLEADRVGVDHLLRDVDHLGVKR